MRTFFAYIFVTTNYLSGMYFIKMTPNLLSNFGKIGQRTKCRNEIRKLSENAYLVIITLENLIYV